MSKIYKKIDEALASPDISDETKSLLIEAQKELKKAKTIKGAIPIIAMIIKIITGLFDDD